ncbi:DUF6932 family protein [Mycolicibacterium fortuitum]|uniref:DUF6932 family protein n=1 Tax=Mycolicibacterium fortuitum TaxID=1766 RepID=UPI001131F92A|nr:hypothetical protein [Mycolicibacterium fortuitum]TPW95710.1 hypothetical protein FKW78_10165 [Mycolicibacterium fortuitum]
MTVELPFDDDGQLLPSDSAYEIDLDSLYEVFVEQAEHRQVRQRIHTALRLHLDILKEIAGSGPVILGGGFISHKDAPPSDVDLTYLCRDSEHLEAAVMHPEALPILTLQKGYAVHPFLVGFSRLQPVGGKVDAFLASPKMHDYWRTMWSTVKGTGHNGIPRIERGYVEVTI